MLNEVKPNLDLLMSIRLGLAEQYEVPLDVPFRDYKAWYRWTGMEVPTQTMRADFVNQLYSKEGKPCRFEDIFEFERLSKAWLIWENSNLLEFKEDVPRQTSAGLFLEQESTNELSHSLNPSQWGVMVTGGQEFKKNIDGNLTRLIVHPAAHTGVPTRVFDAREGSTLSSTFIGGETTSSRLDSLVSTILRNNTTTTNLRTCTAPLGELGSFDNVVPLVDGIYEYSMTYSREGRWSVGDRMSFYHGPMKSMVGGYYDYCGSQVEFGEKSSFIVTENTPATRLKDSLSTTIPQGHTISGDWDDTLHLFERDGQLDFEGYGYIRTLEMIPMVGSYTADFTKDTIISHTGFEHRGIFGRGIFEFERLSKAWTWESNKGMVEFDVNAPRITYEGLRLEPESTNFLVDSFLSSGRVGMQTVGGDLFFGVDELGAHIHFKQTLNDNYAYKTYQDLDAPAGSHSLTYASDTTGLSFGSSGGSFSLQTVGVSGSLGEVSYGVYSGKANMLATGQAGNSRGFVKRTSHDTKEPKFYLYQLEGYPRYTSPIKTEDAPTTRLPETLTHPTSLEFLTIDKDEGILHEDGVFSGFGYIRKIEVKV